MAAAAARAVIPDFKFPKAAASSVLLVPAVDVKVNPLSVKPCPAVNVGKVMAVVSFEPKLLAAVPATPVTPIGFEGGVVSKPRPKSDP